MERADWEAFQQSSIEAAEQIVVERKVALQKAEQRPRMLQDRHAELLHLNVTKHGTLMAESNALLDEAVWGDPPLQEWAVKYETLHALDNFLTRAITRLVMVHRPQADREVLVARHAVANASAELLDGRAVLSMARRFRLLGPLMQHEQVLTITQGGVTDALVNAAVDARLEALKLADAIREHDQRTQEMQLKFSL